MGVSVLTDKHIEFIKKNYLLMSGHDMDNALKLSQGLSDRAKKRFGLVVPKEVSVKFRADKNRRRTSSTPEVDYLITELYLLLPVNTLANLIGRSETFVKTRKRQLNLITPRHIVEEFIKSTQIKKGNISYNKGLKQSEYMSKEQIEKTKATRFKKGGLPHTTLYDGAIRIRHRNDRDQKPHKHIRISKGKWQELQIYNWEKVKGPVPKDHVLACKDGDTLNCDPSNWYLLSKKKNAIRNSGSLNLSDGYVAMTIAGKNHPDLIPELKQNKKLIEAKRQLIILNRTINDTAGNPKQT